LIGCTAFPDGRIIIRPIGAVAMGACVVAALSSFPGTTTGTGITITGVTSMFIRAMDTSTGIIIVIIIIGIAGDTDTVDQV
jgi:hypothetical protein